MFLLLFMLLLLLLLLLLPGPFPCLGLTFDLGAADQGQALLGRRDLG